MSTNVVITMAGFGRRFLDAGYTVPKYQIEAHGHSLFWWSLIGLQHLFADSRFVFVVRADDRAAAFVDDECARLGIKEHRTVELSAPTNGQATTAMLALPECRGPGPMAIFNIDTHIRPGTLGEPPAHCDGWIPCFEAAGDHWSFVRLGDGGLAVEVREKKRISPYATIGFYWFRSCALYEAAYSSYYFTSNHHEAGEAFVAPLYNQLIREGKKVRISMLPLDATAAMGTPAELERFRLGPAPA
jgi:hypothetical protein